MTSLTQRSKDGNSLNLLLDQSALDRNGKGSGDAATRLNAENTDFAAKSQDYSDAILACKEA